MTWSWKACAWFAAATAAVLVLATSALAVGARSRSAAAQWQSSIRAVSWSGNLSALYPGLANDTERFAFEVANRGSGPESLSSITVAMRVAPNGDAETAAGGDIRGCRADWFSVSLDHGDPPVPAQIAAGASYTGQVDLALRDSGTNQDGCGGAAPAFTITAG